MRIAMRLDQYLVESGSVLSRTDAKRFITLGCVVVNGAVVTKPAFTVDVSIHSVSVDTSSKRFVSRGGLKLEYALNQFGIIVNGKRALDVGASSGGFTDCLLKHGAHHVIAIDSGTGQLSADLLSDERVTSIEGYNARYLKESDLHYVPDLAVMDVSFISAKLIMPAIYSCLCTGADYICLVKPQFEVGRSGLGKNGIVKDERLRTNALNSVMDFGASIGFTVKGFVKSPIEGGDGNIEFLVHFRKEGQGLCAK